jgi:hypothetical protein
MSPIVTENLPPANKDVIDLSTIKDNADYDEYVEENNANYNAVQKKLVRKLDMTLMPMVFILYLFNYLDRNNIA